MSHAAEFEALYLKLPTALQNAVVSLEGFRLVRRRYSKEFHAAYSAALARGRLSEEALRTTQRERLAAFLKVAGQSPFWNERFEKFGVHLQADDAFAQLAKLPILSKAEARQNAESIVSPLLPESERLPCHTSGTTGMGLVFCESREAERERWANWWRYRSWHGLTLSTRCGYFGGRSIVPLEQNRPPFWRVNWPARQLMFSAYHLGRDTAASYIAAMHRYAVPWLHGYPSTLALLASYVLEGKYGPFPQLRLVTTGAESLLPQQHALIGQAFGVPVVEHYGQAEAVANFSGCELGYLHVDEDYAFVEFVPLEDDPGQYRIVGTNWTNSAFPLLRYDTGDIATLCDATCRCGRPGRLVAEVDGRKEDYLLLPSGASVGRLDHIFKDLVHIREAQIYQPDPDRAIFRVVKGEGYDASHEEERLLAEAYKRIGTELKIELQYVEHLERGNNGKLRFVISDVTPLFRR